MAVDNTTLWNAWVTRRDEAAFETLVRPELSATYNLARRMGLPDADAHDVVQEALSELAQTRTRKPGEVGVGAWLMRTVRMRSLMTQRGERRRKRRERRKAEATRGATTDAAAFDVEEEVERALGLLSDDDRQILELRFIYDLDYREISYVLGVSENACRIRVHRASERMRKRIGNKAPTLLAALPLAALPDAANVIAVAAQSAAGANAAGTLLGGALMSTGIKMAASAAAAALLTAGAFVAFDKQPEPVAPDGTIAAAEDDGGARSGTAAKPDALTSVAPALKTREGFGGNGVIRGRVTLADGTGVGGVVLVGMPRDPSRHAGRAGVAPPAPDLDDEIRRAAVAAHRRVTGTRRATTTADGYYKLAGLGAAQHRVTAFAKGHDIRPAPGQNAYTAEPGATVDFTATLATRVRVHVTGIDRALKGQLGVVRSRTKEGLLRSGASWWSPEQPLVKLEPGTWWVQAVQGNDRELASEPQQITLVAGQDLPPLHLELKGRPGLRGTVVFRDGLTAKYVHVHAMALGAAEVPATWEPGTSQGVLTAHYDRTKRRFAFAEIQPGRYLVGVTLASSVTLGLTAVEVVDRMVDQEIEVILTDTSKYVVVHVLGPDGSPLPADQLDISASFRGDTMGIAGGGHALRRKDGAWLVAQNPKVPAPIDADGKKVKGEWGLRIIQRGVGTKHVTYDPTSPEALRVKFSEPATLAVTLSGLGRSPLTGAASLFLVGGLSETRLSYGGATATRAGNTFTFTNVQAGTHWVALAHRDPKIASVGLRTTVVDMRRVEVREGANALTWSVPSLHELRVDPPAGATWMTFRLVRLDAAGNWLKQQAGATTERGAAVFKYLPAGRYELRGRIGDKEKRVPVQIPGDKVIRLD